MGHHLDAEIALSGSGDLVRMSVDCLHCSVPDEKTQPTVGGAIPAGLITKSNLEERAFVLLFCLFSVLGARPS